MTAPSPREAEALFGHRAAAAQLEQAARSGRLHHAWLLTGPPGVGKATLCFRFARWLLAGMPESAEAPLALPPSHPVFRRVAAGSHADLAVLAPEGGEGRRAMIRVEEVRRLRGFLSLTPAEGGWRVVVIDQPEAMDAAGQNALLKTLEEPPPRAILLMACAAPGRLLPTILSRVRRLPLSPLEEGEMAAFLSAALPDLPAEQRAALIAIAGGSPGQALLLAEGAGVELAALAEEALAGVAGRRAWEIAERVAGRDAGPMALFFVLLRARLAAGLTAQTPPAWRARRTDAQWAELWSRLGEHARAAERLSLERKQAVLTALSWLR
ncbi:MAG: DNA polymerase III subunit delta' [Rhodovarius sp.]|nr:DNA polymerase III subunit delta' [Rhodovarius sp.]MCX7933086.1 DNA polymerase III subunit delta' [Rhodovarius sp.]